MPAISRCKWLSCSLVTDAPRLAGEHAEVPLQRRQFPASVVREVSERELRDQSGEIIRQLHQGQTFVVTCHGAPIGALTPFPQRRFVRAEAVLAVFRNAPGVVFGAVPRRPGRHHHEIARRSSLWRAPKRHQAAQSISACTATQEVSGLQVGA